MPYIPIIIGALVLLILMFWIVSTQRTLAMLDENINNAMSQVGVQLSSRWDALSALLDLTRAYAAHEHQTLIETVKARRSIGADSSPKEACEQENLFLGAMGRIMALAEQYPTLKADGNYRDTMESVNQYESMVRQSRLVYNDSVTKLNRQIRMIPNCLLAAPLGFSRRDYLEAVDGKAEMLSMK